MVKTCNCEKHPCKCKHSKKHGFNEEVIRVPKVYDWANDSTKVKKEVFFGEQQICAIEEALEDPSRRPLRLVAKAPKTPPVFPMKHSDPDHVNGEGFWCEQIGKKRDVVVPIDGNFVDAQEVDLLLNAEIEIEVVDRHGELVTEASVDVTTIDTFVLCYPDGTELLCRIQKILAEIVSPTLFLNNHFPHSFKLEVNFCVDVQVEAEVKLEVLGKFATPRENNLEAISGEEEHCPPIEFPSQCPAIFPVHVSKCEAEGEASGRTETHPHGTASVLVNISSRDLDDGRFDFTFDPHHDEDHDEAFFFKATKFDEDSLQCKDFHDGKLLDISGSGRTDDGHHLDFRLALVDDSEKDRFQVKFLDPRTGEEVYNTGHVEVETGKIKIED